MRTAKVFSQTRLLVLAIIILIGTSGWLGYVVAIPAPSRTSIIEPGSLTSAYCTHEIYLDGTTWLARNCQTGANDATSTTVSALLNTEIAADSANGGGIEYIQNSGTVSTGLWGTTQITLKSNTQVHFEWGATYNIATGSGTTVFKGTDASGAYHLFFGGLFYLYNTNQIFLNLTNSLEGDIYISQIGSGTGSIISGTKVLTLGGNPAYYNKITVLNAFAMDTVLDFPFFAVGANANTVQFLNCNKVNYCIKIGPGVSDNLIQRVVIDSGGITTGGTDAGIYINGFSNVIQYLYGEYSLGGFTGPLLYLDTSAQKNIVQQVLQEGSGGLITDSATIHNNLVKQYPTPASGTVSEGATPWTYTNIDGMQEQMILYNLGNLSSWTCQGITFPNTSGTICLLAPNQQLIVTCAAACTGNFYKVYVAS